MNVENHTYCQVGHSAHDGRIDLAIDEAHF